MYVTDDGLESLRTFVFIFADELDAVRKRLLLGADAEGRIFLTIGVDAHTAVAPL